MRSVEDLSSIMSLLLSSGSSNFGACSSVPDFLIVFNNCRLLQIQPWTVVVINVFFFCLLLRSTRKTSQTQPSYKPFCPHWLTCSLNNFMFKNDNIWETLCEISFLQLLSDIYSACLKEGWNQRCDLARPLRMMVQRWKTYWLHAWVCHIVDRRSFTCLHSFESNPWMHLLQHRYKVRTFFWIFLASLKCKPKEQISFSQWSGQNDICL
jgi:hypothetical protein